MYTFLIVLILIASVLMVLAVLVQNPKSGMASNFGASNQVMGVRQTTDFLEKFTWGAAATVLVLSLVSTIFIDKSQVVSSKSEDAKNILNEAAATAETLEIPSADVVNVTEEGATEAAPAAETAPATEAAPATETAPAVETAPAAEATPAQ